MAKQHYVDNKRLYEVLVKYKNACARRPKNPPPIPEYVGECLLMIANGLATRPNFAGYTFRDDMVSYALENCIQYLHNFDPAKSQNPFAYFTQTIYYAFLRRIKHEKRETYRKYKYAIHQSRTNADYVSAEGESHQLQPPTWMSYDNIHEFVDEYERKMEHRRRARVDAGEDDVAALDVLDPDSAEFEVDGRRVDTSDDTEGSDE